jgi:D-alanine-D-alanine ligase
MKKNIVVIFGGKSTEHDISILSAMQMINALDKNKYNVHPIYIAHGGSWFCDDALKDVKVYQSFNQKKYKQVAILPSDNRLYKKTIFGFRPMFRVDCAIISCHGKNGEDGTLQGLLELSNIPYTSCGVLGSAIGLDKAVMKQIFAYNKIPITKFVVLKKVNFEQKNFKLCSITNKLKLPVVVKPNRLGSSIGISICKTESQLLDALKLAFIFDDKVVIEKMVQNLKEVNISVLGSENSALLSCTEEVKNDGKFLSFEKKYISPNLKNCDKNEQKIIKNGQQTANFGQKCDNFKKVNTKVSIHCCKKNIDNIKVNYSKLNCACEGNEGLKQFDARGDTQNNRYKTAGIKNGMQNLDRIIPANITQKQNRQIQILAKKIFDVVGCSGVVRIDFMIDTKTGEVFANEINTIPGSFAFYLWNNKGINFAELSDRLIQIAVDNNNNKNKLVSNFFSGVLGGKAGIK